MAAGHVSVPSADKQTVVVSLFGSIRVMRAS